MTANNTSSLKKSGFLIAPLIFSLLLILPPPEGLQMTGWRVAAIGVLMATFWVTESIPIPVTAMFPIVLFPLFGIKDVKTAAAPYANPLIFLFMGGFIIAISMQRWNLHKRIALSIIAAVGMNQRSILTGFMLATAVLSMWVSNTATTLMVLPIAISVVELARGSQSTLVSDNFSRALLIGLAYASSIGGLGTLVGTPPNALLAGFLHESYNITIGFAQWMAVGLPLVLIGLPIGFFVLTVLAFPLTRTSTTLGHNIIRDELEKLGPMTSPEKKTAAIFALVAILWICRPLLSKFLPGLTDTGIALLGAFLTFFTLSGSEKSTFLLDWKTAENLPWGILLLFGGGLSLAGAINSTGLSTWIGGQLSVMQAAPVWLIALTVTGVIILLTEITSNTATAAAFLPIMAALALSLGQNPLLLLLPATIASSCAFMLPVATPPNAIVFGSGNLEIVHMVKAGIYMNLLFTLLITILTFTLAPAIFDIQLNIIPAWAH